jgi:hypothetical protein
VPATAKTYISCIVAIGLLVLLPSVWFFRSEDGMRFAVFALLALVASAMKVRLPGITGTYSLSFLIVLTAVTTFSLPETVLLAAVSALVQCVWRPKQRPTFLQVLFNVSVLALTGAVCHVVYWQLQANGMSGYEIPGMALVAAIFWTINTGLVSGVLALLNEGTLCDVWRHWHLWSLPYYVAGATVAGVVSSTMRRGQWPAALAMLPLMGLLWVSYRLWMERQHAGVPPRSAV